MRGDKFERTFFLEVDRSTETQEVLIARTGCYHQYYKSGGFAVRNGAHRDEYKQFPFRVLIVFKTAERRNNTAGRLLQTNLPIFKQVCLSTLEEVIRDPFGKIWVNPADYREVTKGTPFDAERQITSRNIRPLPERDTLGYKRQSAREDFVERNVRKLRILVEEAESVTASLETTR